MLSLLTIALLALPGYAVPQAAASATPSALPAQGGPTTPGKPVTGGGNPSETNPSIPNVANATNAKCVPWYGIRDAIMGGLYQGSHSLVLNDWLTGDSRSMR